MDDQQAQALGRILRERREALSESIRSLAERSGVPTTTIHHFEQGRTAAPAPDKLGRIASALGLSLAEVYSVAGWSIPKDLPTFKPYLRTKYADLPQEDVDAIERYAAKFAKKHGISLTGPALGEDET